MELSREVYQLIVQQFSSRSDFFALTLVSRAFQRAAERALYNTLVLSDPTTTVNICHTLSSNPRLSPLVDALTIFASSSEAEDDEGGNAVDLPDGYWESIASALVLTVRLRHLNIHVDGDTSFAWVLRGVRFKLESFHCDLAWDVDLINFLNSQERLRDLYLADYTSPSLPSATRDEADCDPQASTTNSVTIRADALPILTILECSFIEAINVLVPGRPVTHIKTCFSREDIPGKTEELRKLGTSLHRASTRVRSLDLADSLYSEDFTLTVLNTISQRLPDLRYFGTLVLPVGLERLRFFGLLMRIRDLHTVELEVSEWEPAPTRPAMRALASELRLYCPSIKCFVFVKEFERTVVHVLNGFCAVDPDAEASIENIWREDRS